MKESFILHTNAWPAIQKLTIEQRGILFTAIMQDQTGEDLPDMDAATEMAFAFIAAQLDRDKEKYEAKAEKRRTAANARWKNASAYKSMQNMQMHNLHYGNENVNVNDNDNVNDNERLESLAALPPLSSKDEAELRAIVGDRADGLIADVSAYYTTHPEKQFPGWPIALAQFDRNQKRWGSKAPKGLQEIVAEAFKEVQ